MLATEHTPVDDVYGPPDLPGVRYVPPQDIFGLPPGLPGARASQYAEMFGVPSRLPGSRASSDESLFGLGQEDKGTGPGWLTITLGLTAAAAVVGLIICLTGGKRSTPAAMTLGEARRKASAACC